MRESFLALVDRLGALLRDGEDMTVALSGEGSDFVRFNHGRVRQAGHVHQATLTLDLIRGRRHALLAYELKHDLEADLAALATRLYDLRMLLPHLPADPHLLLPTDVRSSDHRDTHSPPDARTLMQEVISESEGLDLVGILASGRLYRGFANSFGQCNWHESSAFHLDWSCHLNADEASKADYAGNQWSGTEFRRRIQRQRVELDIMRRPPMALKPGIYRVFLAPAAVREILDLLSWDGFGLRAHRNAETPLIRMVCEGIKLHPKLSLVEHGAGGVAPRFTSSGFIKPERVELIRRGAYKDCLVDPRSAREFGALVTGEEFPESLELQGGELAKDSVTQTLGQGLLINNLWYCNFSNPNDCRITGMTRFACFWVDNGEIKAPVNVMRFDDSLYRMFGEALVDLTRERDLILDSGTYDGRSTTSYLVPGALVRAMRFTL